MNNNWVTSGPIPDPEDKRQDDAAENTVPEIVDAEIIEESTGGFGQHDTPGKSSSLWTNILSIVGVYIASMIVVGLLVFAMGNIFSWNKDVVEFITYLLTFGITISFAVWILKRKGYMRPVLSFSLRQTTPMLILWGLILIIITSVVTEPLVLLFPEIGTDLLLDLVKPGVWSIIMLVIMAPVLEELLFRGIIQEAVMREKGPGIAILVSAGIFGIIHWIPQQVVGAFFAGLILGYIYYKTRSLVPVIILHAINNALSYIIMNLGETPSNVTLRELISNDTWYWIVYCLCLLVFIIAAVKVWAQLDKTAANDNAIQKS